MPDAIDGDFSRSQAVLIGTWDYDDLAPVPAARHSLERMRSLLTGPLCAWLSDRVFTASNHRLPQDLPDLLVEKFEEATDVALFYFVGHGQIDPDDQLCLALGETSTKPTRRRTTSLTFEHVKHAFRMSAAPVKIAILDCCFAGMAVDQAGRLSDTPGLPQSPPGTYLMMASGPYSTAWYQLAGEHPQPQTYFTKSMIDVVERGIPSQAPGLTIGDIFDRTADILVRDGKPEPGCQIFDRATHFVFARNAGTRATTGWLPVDAKADSLATSGELAPLTDATARTKAGELGLRLTDDDEPGVRIGISVSGGMTMYGSYEQTHLDIWGLRQGKTTSRVIPAVLDAPGPVFVASSRRDVVIATREVREERRPGTTFVFDPQDVSGEQPSWCWDPIAWVRGGSREDLARAEIRAAKLAAHFAHSVDGRDEKSDASFDPEGEDLLVGLILAAAVARRSIRAVWEWLSDTFDDSPVQILMASAPNRNLPAALGLRAQYNTDVRTRNRIFGAAKRMARCLQLSSIYPWVEQDGSRTPLDEARFVEEGGTLYALSLEGRGNASPLVSALAEAVLDAATNQAARSDLGRLPTPMLAVFDEAAHMVRWRDLPRLYRRFGSSGIVVMTLLQSWAQGVQCWSPDGMAALWAAADIRVIGGGLDDIAFLRERFEAMVNDNVTPESTGEQPLSSSQRAVQFSVSDFVSLPRGRVVAFPSGGKPVLMRTVPWWEGEYAHRVRESYARQLAVSSTWAEDIDETPPS
ncbi:TraM recognition domain-containing protein [Nocardia sp. NPDC050710]|uniref:caspase, EACC1-associated type n=1 Tax=Nocardia sp. NPDC050710 TaxID=3157220 RepID=UPI0033DB9683